MADAPENRSRRHRVLHGGGWTIAGYICNSLLRLGGNLLLTRLLLPEMFGVMAVVYVLMTGFALLSDVGLNLNIVQSRRGEDPVFLDTVWIIQICRGALIWVLAILLAGLLPLLAQTLSLRADSVYLDPILPAVISVYGVTNFILGFQSTKLALSHRKVDLARVTQMELISQVLALVVMVSIAATYRSIWALVAGAIVATFTQVLLSHLWLPGPSNRLRWDASAFREIIGFGKWVFLSSLLSFVAVNGDRLLLGGMIDSRLLGLYSIAFLLISVPHILMSRLLGRVAFPVMSEIVRDHPERLRATYYRFRLAADAGMLCLAGALFMCGDSVVRMLYDSRYAGAGPIMSVLALTLVAERHMVAIQCFLALGKPEIYARFNLGRLVSLCVLPIGFSLYQLDGVLWALAVRPFLTLPIIFYYKRKHGLIDVKKELLVLPLVLAGAGAGWLVDRLLGML